MELHVHPIPAYKAFFKTAARFALLRGGAGSGKSYAAAQKTLIRCIAERHRWLCVRKTYRTIKESQFALLCRVASEMGLKYTTTLSPLAMRVGQSEILFSGLDDTEKMKSIDGISSVWGEEASEFDESDFTELNRRVRLQNGPFPQFVYTFNPTSKSRPIYPLFYAPGAQFASQLHETHTTWRDNPYLPPDYHQQLGAREGELRVYDFGEWGQPQGAVYDAFTYTDAWPKSPDEVWYSQDFGFNNPTAIIEYAAKDLVIYARERLYRSGMSSDTMVEESKAIIGEGPYNYCDGADAQAIRDLRLAGVVAIPARKEVKDGIARVRMLARTKRLVIHKDSLNLRREAEGYVYKEIPGMLDHDGNPLYTEEPIKHNDHLMDALRYGIYTHTLRNPHYLPRTA